MYQIILIVPFLGQLDFYIEDIAEAQKRTIASILGNTPPDLINLNPEFSVSLAQIGVLNYFSEEDAKDYLPSLVDKLRYEGKIYALPFYATSAVTIFNKESFKDCNIDIKTYDDILKLKNCKKPPVYGINLNENDTFSKILNKYDIKDEDDIKDVYYLFKKMNDEGLLLKDTLTINHRELVEKYMSNSASFIVTGSNFINMIKENAPDIYKNSYIKPQLTGKNGKYDVSIMNFIIPKRAKNVELAKEFIEQLLSKENQIEFSKKTNTLPVNKSALLNSYFKNCSNELIEKSRCTSIKQLNNPNNDSFGYKNKKEINETINNYLENLFINGIKSFNSKELFYKIEELKEN